MAVPSTVRVPVEFDWVCPNGLLCLGVEAVRDFEAKGKDVQARDPDTGERLWAVKCLDLDPEAGKYGRSKEITVVVPAPVQPVPPASAMPGYPPSVAFTGMTISPR